jgi:cysteinyl-tRNA synthetase
LNDGKETITQKDKASLLKEMKGFLMDVLGVKGEETQADDRLSPVMDLVLELRQSAREAKDWTMSDKIRDGLLAAGIIVKDSKEGTSWK